jgi:hypothetical protein
MTDQHPITPPPELVEKWKQTWLTTNMPGTDLKNFVATQAAHWVADQQLEACCEWLDYNYPSVNVDRLRAVMRPQPSSLNEVALQMLGTIERDAHYLPEITDTIRRALEQLDD